MPSIHFSYCFFRSKSLKLILLNYCYEAPYFKLLEMGWLCPTGQISVHFLSNIRREAVCKGSLFVTLWRLIYGCFKINRFIISSYQCLLIHAHIRASITYDPLLVKFPHRSHSVDLNINNVFKTYCKKFAPLVSIPGGFRAYAFPIVN